MKLSEIITANEDHEQSILIEKMIPYKRSLLTYYTDEFCGEPILMVTSVSNAAQYGKIVPANEFIDAVFAYMDSYDCMDEDNERFGEYETICYNSIPLSKL